MAFARQLGTLAFILGVVVGAFASTGYAVQPDEVLIDATLEARARSLSMELRCVVCQNQSIDDSDAPLARDLRLLVRERLVAGDSNIQVMDFIVARYGEFVLLRPRFGAHTAVLWLLPFLLLGTSLFWLFRRHGNRGDVRVADNASRHLSEEEELQLSRMLENRSDGSVPKE